MVSVQNMYLFSNVHTSSSDVKLKMPKNPPKKSNSLQCYVNGIWALLAGIHTIKMHEKLDNLGAGFWF